ncbi:PREDICTED: transcription initiation factor IIA subunit 1-like isoform X1 [Camelina sativa]|uniref:Transcription initiation factor IIA subunit 1-like isoform X1 n=1 Tax=Camelina sativa TaxID=90675 RepID=A0ABM1R6W4_CAMSA|nr:PREDICTED: transcription initiation factor IIA subunit 1-like isoform X1 [Camelina sativa]XP_019094753.1 PREDICTED: transcription initiation factor IIA subunit 1-like isoform X1 [Camelina sativa]
MGTTTTTSAVYIQVIEDVVNKVREEFINNGGPGESVLSELQGIWETKMMQAGVLNGPIERSSAQKPTPGGPLTHDLNVPYEGTEEYETPTAEMLFPPTPLQTPLPTPLPGTADNSSIYNIPTGSSDYPTPGTDNGSNADIKGRPSPYMPPPSPWTNPRLDVNVAYVDGRDEPERGNSNQQFTQDLFVPSSGKRKRDDSSAPYQNGGSIPQQDGACDAIPKANFECEALRITYVGNKKIPRDFICSSSKIPQADGPMPDPYDEMLSTPNIYSYQGPSEEFNEARTPAPNEIQTSTPVAVQNDIIEDDEELLNEDDDDDELDDLESGEDMNTQHLVLAQFDKVTRTKSRWKCSLKDGIMHINDKDILFNKVICASQISLVLFW